MGMEIERKYIIKELPQDLQQFPFHAIEQCYLNTHPTVRARKEDDEYYMTYKGEGTVSKVEYNLPLNKESYEHLRAKADGNVITKKRYLLPLNEDAFSKEDIQSDPELERALAEKSMKIELDVFEGAFQGLVFAEVEFPSSHAADVYVPAKWFGSDVSEDKHFSNAYLSSINEKEIDRFLNNNML